MDCYDCALEDTATPAIAVCDSCGCGVCVRHAHVSGRLVERLGGPRPGYRRKLARRLTCGVCRAVEAFDHVRCAG